MDHPASWTFDTHINSNSCISNSTVLLCQNCKALLYCWAQNSKNMSHQSLNMSHQRFDTYLISNIFISWKNISASESSITVNKATAHLASKQSLLDHWLCMHENGAPETLHPERLPWRYKQLQEPLRATGCQRAQFNFCFKCRIKSEPQKIFTAEKVGHLLTHSPNIPKLHRAVLNCPTNDVLLFCYKH